MTEYKVENHESSYLPDGYDWKLSFSDEFDAPVLDKNIWSFRKHLFHTQNECWTEDEGIEFKDGNIIFKLVEKDGKYYCCQLQTGENWYDRPAPEGTVWNVAKFKKQNFLHKFGYYEIRCKLQKGDNWWSSFWLQSPNIGTQPDEKKAGVEVDILESFFGGTYIPHFIHWGGYADDHKYASTLTEHRESEKRDSIALDDGYHRFGCMWDKDGYTFFVDGVQSGRKLTEAVSHTPQFILLGTEIVGSRAGGVPGLYRADKNLKVVKDDKFTVDYVRVFDMQ